jgi:CheY-like chemotaxis protein
VLVVEDGHEYITTLERYLGEVFEFVRAGDGPEALERVGSETWHVVFLDMRFDRTPAGRLLGDLAVTADRFNGDTHRATRFLEDHQGTYVLSALREAGCMLPVVMSYDFDNEPRRWTHLSKRFSPVHYLADNADPGLIQQTLWSCAGAV